jgi:hypothetical protein
MINLDQIDGILGHSTSHYVASVVVFRLTCCTGYCVGCTVFGVLPAVLPIGLFDAIGVVLRQV